MALAKGFVATSAPAQWGLPHERLADGWPHPVGIVSGPTFALEVAQGLPTALVVASTDAALTADVAGLLRGDTLRAYPSDDLAGVEVGGAVKNVLAIAAGASDGLGFGDNARAALITRGLAESGRLSAALGGRRETLMGLAGLGDLVLTCTGNLSRNRQVGLALSRGQPLAAILAEHRPRRRRCRRDARRARACAASWRRHADRRGRASRSVRRHVGPRRGAGAARARAARGMIDAPGAHDSGVRARLTDTVQGAPSLTPVIG